MNLNSMHSDMIAPRADEFSLGAERALIADLAAKLYFTGKFTRNLYAFDETNLYWDEDGYNIIGTGNGSVIRTIDSVHLISLSVTTFVRT